MSVNGKRERHMVQLTITLVLFAAAVYALVFIKLPVWLPALK